MKRVTATIAKLEELADSILAEIKTPEEVKKEIQTVLVEYKKN